MIEIPVSPGEGSQRLDKFLQRVLPAAGSGRLYRMLRKKQIVLNRRKAEGSDRVGPGDVVGFYLSDSTFRLFQGEGEQEEEISSPFWPLEILYETGGLLAIGKPPGLLSQKAAASDVSACELVRRYLKEKGVLPERFSPSAVHRLDRNTSGVLLCAKTLAGAQTASAWIREGKLKKNYRCFSHGPFREVPEVEWLIKDRQKNTVRVSSRPREGAEEIRTGVRVMRELKKGVLELEIDLCTGKSHQIRSQLAFHGMPILGDPKYGDRGKDQKLGLKSPLSRQLLHAFRLTLPEGTVVSAPYEKDMKHVYLELGGGTGE